MDSAASLSASSNATTISKNFWFVGQKLRLKTHGFSLRGGIKVWDRGLER